MGMQFIAEKAFRDGRIEYLRRLWAEGARRPLAEIGPDTDLMAAGGDSFAAVQLEAQIEAEFGISLPPHAVIEAPTPAAMADMIGEAIRNPAIHLGLTPLTRLQGGDGTPLFTFPGGDATHAYFEAWLGRVATPGRPVFAVVDMVGDTSGPTEEWVARNADRYEAMILAEWPEGPWLLFAVCLSTAVCWEVARRLSRRGEVHLLLLDPAQMDLGSGPGPFWQRRMSLRDHQPQPFKGHLSLLLTARWNRRLEAARWAALGTGEVRTEILPEGELGGHGFFFRAMVHIAPAVRAWVEAALAGRP